MSEQQVEALGQRSCGHEWRNNDFDCLDCVDKRRRKLEDALQQILEGRFRYNMGDYETCAKNTARLVLDGVDPQPTSERRCGECVKLQQRVLDLETEIDTKRGYL